MGRRLVNDGHRYRHVDLLQELAQDGVVVGVPADVQTFPVLSDGEILKIGFGSFNGYGVFGTRCYLDVEMIACIDFREASDAEVSDDGRLLDHRFDRN